MHLLCQISLSMVCCNIGLGVTLRILSVVDEYILSSHLWAEYNSGNLQVAAKTVACCAFLYWIAVCMIWSNWSYSYGLSADRRLKCNFNSRSWAKYTSLYRSLFASQFCGSILSLRIRIHAFSMLPCWKLLRDIHISFICVHSSHISIALLDI